MKKAVLFLVFFSVVLVACKEENGPMDPSKIVGKWVVNQMWSSSTNGYIDYKPAAWYAQFNSDGTYKSYSGTSYSGTYKIIGNNIEAYVGSNTIEYEYISLKGDSAEYKMYFKLLPSESVKFKAVRE